MSLSINCKRFRTMRGLTQQQLAAEMGVATPRVSEIENGHNANPKLETVVLLAEKLDITIDRLLKPPPKKYRQNA